MSKLSWEEILRRGLGGTLPISADASYKYRGNVYMNIFVEGFGTL